MACESGPSIKRPELDALAQIGGVSIQSEKRRGKTMRQERWMMMKPP
jgi:hypothetical protein